MKRKNFTSTPNDFLLDEKKEHNANQILKNATEKLIVVIFEGLQAKYGKEFQKSAKQLANMCLVARSTFIKNIDNLIDRGIISKRVEKIEGSKENETTYWTLNLTFPFDYEIEENEVILNSDNVQNETTLTENNIGVIPNSDNGCPNIGQKKDFKDLKDLEEENNNNIYNKPHFKRLLLALENTGIENILNNKGFSHGTIKEIKKKITIKLFNKDLSLISLRDNFIENAVIEYNKDKNNNIHSHSGLYVHKLVQVIDNFNIESNENERKLNEYNNAI